MGSELLRSRFEKVNAHVRGAFTSTIPRVHLVTPIEGRVSLLVVMMPLPHGGGRFFTLPLLVFLRLL